MNEWTETDRLIERLEVEAIRNPESAEKMARRYLREVASRDEEARLKGFLAGLVRREGFPREAKRMLRGAFSLAMTDATVSELYRRRALAELDQAFLREAEVTASRALDIAMNTGSETISGRASLVVGIIAWHCDQLWRSHLAWTDAIKKISLRSPGGRRFRHTAHVNRGIARLELGDTAGAEKDLKRSRTVYRGIGHQSPRLAARLASHHGRWEEAVEAQQWIVDHTSAPTSKAAEAVNLIEWKLRAGDSRGAAATGMAMAAILGEHEDLNEYTEAVICGLVQASDQGRLDLAVVEAARQRLEQISREAQQRRGRGRRGRRRRR